MLELSSATSAPLAALWLLVHLVLVVGATGRTGARVVELLLRRKTEVIAGVRREQRDAAERPVVPRLLDRALEGHVEDEALDVGVARVAVAAHGQAARAAQLGIRVQRRDRRPVARAVHGGPADERAPVEREAEHRLRQDTIGISSILAKLAAAQTNCPSPDATAYEAEDAAREAYNTASSCFDHGGASLPTSPRRQDDASS